MTAELTTRFRTHTPIETTLRVEARLESVDGRKIRTCGELYAGELMVADASGLFIAVGSQKFADLFEATDKA